MTKNVVLVLKGVVIGVANIIPGVSGGTMALVLGIYDRLIQAVGRLGFGAVKEFVSACRTRGGVFDFARRHDLAFLMWLGVGAAAAVVLVSRVMKYLLQDHHDPTYGFFLGLVAASILVPYSLLPRKSWREALCAVIFAVATVGLANLQSPEERLAAAEEKARIKASAAEDPSAKTLPDNEATTPAPPLQELAFLFVVGVIAASAMILPGVSGSFILLLFGAYFDVLRAINERDLLVIAVVGAGCAVGLVYFSKLLTIPLRRWYSLTMASLLGLMLGSLWELWPFKEHAFVGESRVDLRNTWPTTFDANTLITTVATLIGIAMVTLFFLYEKRLKARDHDATPNSETVTAEP